MRIACIHIPQFALQSATRVDPALRGAPVAVVSGVEPGRSLDSGAGVLHAPIVLACSRSAWAQGVRLGMTAAAARSQSPTVQIVTADAALERETVRAIADAVLGVSSVVDVGGRVGAGGAHLAMYAEVPAKTRGAAFGERLLDLLDELGLAARIGIADDRFTAWVAAAHGHDERARLADVAGNQAARERSTGSAAPVTASVLGSPGSIERSVIVVPRGGSAAFLAPRPLSLLAISPEVQHMLEALGVRTLGEFAALPAPSVARPLDADYRALARGESDATLRSYAPEAPIREEVTVSAGNVLELRDLLPAGEHANGLSLAAAIALIVRRVELRLAGRGRGAARLDISAIGNAETIELPVTLDRGLADAESLAHVVATALESTAARLSVSADAQHEWRLRVVVAGEMILGGETTEIFAAGSAAHAFDSIYATGSSGSAVYSGSADVANDDDFSRDPREHRPRAGQSDPRRRTADHLRAEPIDPLAVVLSSSGSLFALSPPSLRAERRDAHRRTRRGKQRRSRPAQQRGQPRLFDRVSSKS